MSARPRSTVLCLAILGAFALGGCEDDDELTDGGTLILDDDRTSGATITVFIALGSQTPTSVTIDAAQSRVLTLTQGTYTITFDDDGTGGVTAGDTVETPVNVETGKSTTVEYAGEDKSGVIGPNLQANG
jgi:major membrane immunogen (membrane-anchored lipoprotein)